MYALNIDKETNRILSVTFDKYGAPNQPRVESLPEGDVSDYLFIDGEYVYDPLPDPVEPELMVEYVTYNELAEAIREGVNSYGQ